MTIRKLEDLELGGITFLIPHPGSPPSEIGMNRQEPGIWFITRILVNKKNRGKGLATELLRAATQWADENKIKIIAEIDSYNDGGLNDDQLEKLCNKNGFRKTDVDAAGLSAAMEMTGLLEICAAPLFIRDPQSKEEK